MSLFNVYEKMKFWVPSCCYIILPKHCCLGVLIRKAPGYGIVLSLIPVAKQLVHLC